MCKFQNVNKRSNDKFNSAVLEKRREDNVCVIVWTK